MFRFTLALVACLSFAVQSHAFSFEDAVQAIETIIKEHSSEFEKGEKTAEQIAQSLDETYAAWKERTKTKFENLLQSSLVTPKIRQSLLDALGLVEQQLTSKIEEVKKALALAEKARGNPKVSASDL